MKTRVYSNIHFFEILYLFLADVCDKNEVYILRAFGQMLLV